MRFTDDLCADELAVPIASMKGDVKDRMVLRELQKLHGFPFFSFFLLFYTEYSVSALYFFGYPGPMHTIGSEEFRCQQT